jgi:hypothetical protein
MKAMETVHTPYGPLAVHGPLERYPDGTLRSCTPAGPAVFQTALGPLPAQHSTDDLRRRTVQPVSFHPTGLLRALPLEEPTLVQTPAGPMTVELVTFHPDGSLSRAFPLNGKLSGLWSQEDEGRLARPVDLRTPAGRVNARIIGLRFNPAGALLGLTLWPGESVEVSTPVGPMAARIGVSFRPDGSLRSLEPACPQAVPTPVGEIKAYDLDAVGISGDVNSLGFGPDGRVERVSTNLTQVAADGPGGERRLFAPEFRESLCGDGEREPVPLRLEFGPDEVRIRTRADAAWTALPLAHWTLRSEPCLLQFAMPLGRMRCPG